MTTLQEDQTKAANQGKPGYDALGNPIGGGGTFKTPSGVSVTTDTAGQITGDTSKSAPGAPTPAGRYPTGYTAPVSGAPAPVDQTTADEQAYQASLKAEDPATVAARINAQYANELQSIRNYYATLVSQQQVVNEDTAGRTRATASATGELGSDIGNTEIQDTADTNQSKIEAIGAEEQTKEAALNTAAATTIESEIQSEKSTAQGGLAAKVTYDQAAATKAQNEISTIAATTDLASLPQNEYDSLYEAAGFATPEEFNTYYNAARVAAQTGGQLIGDATTGVYQKQLDGTWKNVIKGKGNFIGDPTVGVWEVQADGSLVNKIPAAPKAVSIGAGGEGVFDPATGTVKVAAAGATKYHTAGGILYAINPQTNAATPIAGSPSAGAGWASTGAGSEQEKAAIAAYITGQGWDLNATIAKLKSDPNAYYDALGQATKQGYYTNVNVGVGTPNTSMQDALDNASSPDTSSTDNTPTTQ